MVQRTGSAGQGNVLFVQNNFYYDAFFLKAIGTPFLRAFFLALEAADLSGWQYSMVPVITGGVQRRIAAHDTMYVCFCAI